MSTQLYHKAYSDASKLGYYHVIKQDSCFSPEQASAINATMVMRYVGESRFFTGVGTMTWINKGTVLVSTNRVLLSTLEADASVSVFFMDGRRATEGLFVPNSSIEFLFFLPAHPEYKQL